MMTTQPHIAGKKVLITGASGFIGSHLCQAAIDRSAQVHGVSRYPPQAGTHSNSMQWWQADVADLDSLRQIWQKVEPDIVYHLASNVTGSRSSEFVLPTLQSNFVSTVNLLTLGNEFGCERIVLSGSLEEPDLAQEAPSSPYAAAKWASSGYARMFHELYQTPVVTAKIFMVYGTAQHSRFLIPYVISSLLAGVPPKLSSGTRPVDWIYIDDLVSGLLAMGTAPNIAGETIDLGSGTLTTVREVVELLVNYIDRQIDPAFGEIPDRPNERVRVADLTRSAALLDWQPATSIDTGLQLTVEWYRKRLL
jgi:UDP-glucose 4-epimerase